MDRDRLQQAAFCSWRSSMLPSWVALVIRTVFRRVPIKLMIAASFGGRVFFEAHLTGKSGKHCSKILQFAMQTDLFARLAGSKDMVCAVHSSDCRFRVEVVSCPHSRWSALNPKHELGTKIVVDSTWARIPSGEKPVWLETPDGNSDPCRTCGCYM